MDVPLEEAFAEACRALGEAVVRERFLTAEIQKQMGAATRADSSAPAGPDGG